jgi:DHA2 family multidrug resistance protein
VDVVRFHQRSGSDDAWRPSAAAWAGFFLSITLIAFTHLNSRNLASGIGLFNTGRQLGGLMGVAGLQTLIDHQVVSNGVVLGANVTPGGHALIERLTTATAMLAGKGMDQLAAGRSHEPAGQRCQVEPRDAFDTAYFAVALLFALPRHLDGVKIGLARQEGSHGSTTH